MSSTQLIEQCATRLRGIVEALDNIHDTSPHRWSTDLDDVHSSAESLLAMINDQASNQAALAQPSPKCATCNGSGFVEFERGAVIKDCPRCHRVAQPSPAQAEQAEAERPEAVGYLLAKGNGTLSILRAGPSDEPVMTVAQHERIVKAWIERWKAYIELSAKIAAQRDAALANVDALAVQVLKLGGTISFAHHRTDQAGQVPQAWLDVQAERRRQVEAEGWTPEHDDEHSHGQMARAAACYALAGSSAPNDGTAALLVSLAWPWDEQWWKPSTARRDMVKACALGLAEIERLDRVAASQGGPSDA